MTARENTAPMTLNRLRGLLDALADDGMPGDTLVVSGNTMRPGETADVLYADGRLCRRLDPPQPAQTEFVGFKTVVLIIG